MLSINRYLKNKTGQTLIEALVALGIAITVISAISSVVITSLSGANYTRDQNKAGAYAQEGMEFIRKSVVSDFNGFITTYTDKYYCLNDQLVLSARGANCSDRLVDKFQRSVDILLNDPDCDNNMKVLVEVSWSDNRCKDSSNLYCHKTNLTSCFADPNAQPSGT